jgi:anti-sigma factor ChrR (cupin superfamily)
VAPRSVLREKLLARVRPPIAQFAPGIFVARASESGWRKTKFAGVSFKELYVDPATQMATSLLRLAPGARYPAHRHTAVEQCLVLEGDVELGALRLSAGDYEWAEASTTHGTIRSDTGCLLLIMASKHDEFLDGS